MMSVLSGLSKGDFKTGSDGLLELSEEKLRSIMRSEPITDVYHVEQTPFARSVTFLITVLSTIGHNNMFYYCYFTQLLLTFMGRQP